MATRDDMLHSIQQSALADVVMKCGQVVCGRVLDMTDDIVVVAENEGGFAWVMRAEIAFIRTHPPLEAVRYPEQQQQQPRPQVGGPPQHYASPYIPTIIDEMPDGRRYPPGPPPPAGPRERLEGVKARHRRAEFAGRQFNQSGQPQAAWSHGDRWNAPPEANDPMWTRRGDAAPQHPPGWPPEQFQRRPGPGQVHRPHIETEELPEEPFEDEGLE